MKFFLLILLSFELNVALKLYNFESKNVPNFIFNVAFKLNFEVVFKFNLKVAVNFT